MKFYGIEMEGRLVLERVQVLPAHAPGDEGRILYVETDKRIFVGQDAGWAEVGSGQGFEPFYVNANHVIEKHNALLLVNTTSGPINVTLPMYPHMGEEIKVVDVAGTFATNNCVLLRNGRTIQNQSRDLTCDVDYLVTTLTYDGIDNWSVTVGGVSQLVAGASRLASGEVGGGDSASALLMDHSGEPWPWDGAGGHQNRSSVLIRTGVTVSGWDAVDSRSFHAMVSGSGVFSGTAHPDHRNFYFLEPQVLFGGYVTEGSPGPVSVHCFGPGAAVAPEDYELQDQGEVFIMVHLRHHAWNDAAKYSLATLKWSLFG
jgi:hypothetical protein